jgi:hypothetical protein
MTKKILKDKKIAEIAKKIAVGRKKNNVDEGDYEKLIALISKLDATSNENLSNLIADAIMESAQNVSQHLHPSDTIGAFIDSTNAKNKYVPKIREATVPIHYKGQEFSMKDLTKKTNNPLHYIFLTQGVYTNLHAFDSYDKINIALEKENLIDTIKLEIDKQYLNTYGTVIVRNPDGSTSTGWVPDPPPPPEYFWPNAERPKVSAFLYEHINFDGEELELMRGRRYVNLPDIWMEWFLFWKESDWNDKISSIRVGDGRVVAFEHIFGAGATLTVNGSVPMPHYTTAYSSLGRPYQRIDFWKHNRRDLPNLVSIGWNDRISSIYHW